MKAKKSISGVERGQATMFDLEEQELIEVTPEDNAKSDKEGKKRKERHRYRRLPDGTMEKFIAPLRVRMTAQIDFDLSERIRDCLFWLAGYPEMYTLTRMMTEAMEERINFLAHKYEGKSFIRNGKFIPRTGDVKTGRPAIHTDDAPGKKRYKKTQQLDD